MINLRNKIYSILGGLSLSVAFTAKAANDDAPGQAARYAALEEEATAYLKNTNHPRYDRAIVLDSEKLETAIVLGNKTPEQAVRGMLEEKGLHKPDAGLVATFARQLFSANRSSLGAPMLSVGPALAPLPDRRACVLLAAPSPVGLAGGTFPLPGLDAETTRAFIDKHELWHCRERMIDHDNFAFVLDALKIGNVRETLENVPGAFRVLPQIFMWETLADVGALGDMIRGGHPPKVIDAVSDWRKLGAERNLLHCSTLALSDLRGRIAKMGVKAFRALPQAEAEKMYEDITRKNGLSTPKAMLAFYLRAFGSEGQQQAVRRAAEHDSDAKNGLYMYVLARWNDTFSLTPEVEMAPKGPENDFIRHVITGWDPMKALRARAKETHGGIGPAALRKTYVEMQQDLREKAEKYPDNPYHAALSVKLRTEFMGAILGIRLLEIKPKPASPPLAAAVP